MNKLKRPFRLIGLLGKLNYDPEQVFKDKLND
jgi:hypothetical protein